MKNSVRITIIVITYNQERIISRCLDSILGQKDFGLKDIIVCDDCSTDNNWEVIKSYSEKYPTYIRAYRNNPNKGIYGNLQHALKYVEETDLVQLCSGDDALCPGYLERIQNYISENSNIDLKSRFVIYSDWKTINPKQEEKIFKNNYIGKQYKAESLKLRGIIYDRSTFLSYATLKSFYPVPVDRGVSVAENLFDIQTQIHSDKNYYCPFVGTIYYSGIGVSVKMHTKEAIYNLIESYHELAKLNIFDRKDLLYIKYLTVRLKYDLCKSISLYFKVWFYYFKSLKYKFDLKFIIIDMIRMIIK